MFDMSLKCMGPAILESATPAAAEEASPRPGLNSCTVTMPIVMETMVATMNHPRDFPPIRRIEAAPSIRATPTTSVENTSGAMIILMRRRKPVVMMDRPADRLSAPGPGPSMSCMANPNSGPAIMAMMTNHVRRDFMR